MFGLSTSHLLIVGLVILIFGSRRLPELGSSLGKALRAFKNATDGSVSNELPSLNSPETKPESKC